MPSVKHSRQRDALLNNLRSRYDHPTAEELYMSLKADFPNISLGTVYRNLNMLCNNGTVRKFSVGDIDRFDAHAENHYHFVCDKCKRIFDVEMPVSQQLNEQAQKYIKGTVNSHFMYFNGICDDCLNKN